MCMRRRRSLRKMLELMTRPCLLRTHRAKWLQIRSIVLGAKAKAGIASYSIRLVVVTSRHQKAVAAHDRIPMVANRQCSFARPKEEWITLSHRQRSKLGLVVRLMGHLRGPLAAEDRASVRAVWLLGGCLSTGVPSHSASKTDARALPSATPRRLRRRPMHHRTCSRNRMLGPNKCHRHRRQALERSLKTL